MGLVYLAEDEALGRQVAIKVLRDTPAEQRDLLLRFQRESVIITRLDHPAIVPIYAVGEDQGIPYFVMRHIEGHSLKTQIDLRREKGHDVAQDPAEIAEALGVIEQVSHAVDHAHRNGIIHRDVKPSNIMLDADGDAQLLDFGLAKIVAEHTVTQAGRMMGTVPYMSPEQISSRFGIVDQRTDIYSLGATLFAVLCGRPPFQAESSNSLLVKIVSDPPPYPRSLCPELSRDVETVILKCLEKRPRDRYQSAFELAEDLARIRAHRQIEAQPVGGLGRLLRWGRRHRLQAGVLGLAFAALLLFAGSLVGDAWSQRKERAKRARVSLAEARQLRTRLSALDEDIRSRRQALRADKRATPDAAALDSDQKRRLFALRHELETLNEERERLPVQIEAALRRSLEADPRGGAVGERESWLFSEYLAASGRGNEARRSRLKEALARTKFADKLTGLGAIDLRSIPSGAIVTARRYRRDEVGRLELSSEPRVLGRTPLIDCPLDEGSWSLRVEAEGHHACDYPVLIERDETWGSPQWKNGMFSERDWTLRLRPEADLDLERWAFVAAGPFLSSASIGGDEPELRWRWLDDYLIARHELDFHAYARFVESEEIQERLDSLRAQLRKGPVTVELRYLPRADGRLFYYRDDGEILTIHALVRDFAACGLSCMDVEEFLAWQLKHESGIRLPRGLEWEKAARGVDGRRYPWGDSFDWSWTSGLRSLPSSGPVQMRPPGSFEGDRSPYGVFDLAGNVAEWCSDGDHSERILNPWICGGWVWAPQAELYQVDPTRVAPIHEARGHYGFRLVRELRP